MAGDTPKLDQAKLAKMQQFVRTGEFCDVPGGKEDRKSVV